MESEILFPSPMKVTFINVSILRYNTVFINLLAEALNVQYQLTPPLDREYGRKLNDGNWTGMIGQVLRGDADLAFSDLSVTDVRKSAVDFSEAYFTNEVTFVTNFPRMIFPKPFDDIKALKSTIWILYMFVLLLSTIVIPGLYKNRITFLASFFSSRFYQLVFKYSFYFKVILGFWVICSTLLVTSYLSCLISLSTYPPDEVIPKNFEELAKLVSAGKYRCISVAEKAELEKMIHKGSSYSKYLAELVLQNKWFVSKQEIVTLKDRSSFDNTAYFMNRAIAYFRFGVPPSNVRYISDDSVTKDFIAIAVRKDFCCLKQINRAIEKFKRAGLIEKHMRDSMFLYFIETRRYDIFDDYLLQLSLQNIQILFFILFSGHLISVLVLLLEIIVWKRNNEQN